LGGGSRLGKTSA
jgi:hypothetical protein